MAAEKGEATRCRWFSERDGGGAARVVVLIHGVGGVSQRHGEHGAGRYGHMGSPNRCDSVAVAIGDDFLCAEL